MLCTSEALAIKRKVRKIKPLFCILGRSGSGKTTMCAALEKTMGIKQIPSYTTRPPRYEGEPGHTFVKESYYPRITGILAENTTTGYKYCVTEKQIENPKYDLYVVDLTGLKALKKNYKGKRRLIAIFLDVPLKQRYDRLKARYIKTMQDAYNPESAEIAINSALERIVSDAVEFQGYEKWCKHIIDNSDGNFEKAFDRVLDIVTEGKIGSNINGKV